MKRNIEEPCCDEPQFRGDSDESGVKERGPAEEGGGSPRGGGRENQKENTQKEEEKEKEKLKGKTSQTIQLKVGYRLKKERKKQEIVL